MKIEILLILIISLDLYLRDMEIQFAEYPKIPNLIARVLSPLGAYPAKSIVMTGSAFIADTDICFTLANYEKLEVKDDNYYSEMEWAQLDEIRLFSSMLLAVDRQQGNTKIYPFP